MPPVAPVETAPLAPETFIPRVQSARPIDHGGRYSAAMTRPDVIALFGPTAVGKTAVAHRARPIGCGGTARIPSPSRPTRSRSTPGSRSSPAPRPRPSGPSSSTACSAFLPVDAQFSAGQYAELAHGEIDDLIAAGRRPIVVGGTGLYLRAALAELSLRPPPADGRARALDSPSCSDRGPAALHASLRAVRLGRRRDRPHRQPADRARPRAASTRASSSPIRGVRALDRATRRPTLLVGLVLERERLYRQIDARVDAMLAAGVEQEVRRAARRWREPDGAQSARLRRSPGRRHRQR